MVQSISVDELAKKLRGWCREGIKAHGSALPNTMDVEWKYLGDEAQEVWRHVAEPVIKLLTPMAPDPMGIDQMAKENYERGLVKIQKDLVEVKEKIRFKNEVIETLIDTIRHLAY